MRKETGQGSVSQERQQIRRRCDLLKGRRKTLSDNITLHTTIQSEHGTMTDDVCDNYSVRVVSLTDCIML